MKKQKTIKGWHFTKADKKLRYNDNRIVTAGETITVDCELKLCNSGLHMSKRITDALKFAPGTYVWRVQTNDSYDIANEFQNVIYDDNKLVSNNRTALWGFDAREIVLKYARKCALDIIHLWDAPDIVIKFLKTGDKSIAREAAYAAAYAAAHAAAHAAASHNSAYAAAYAVNYATARIKAKNKQEKRLSAMIFAEARKRGLI
jgi:hypothetical protein